MRLARKLLIIVVVLGGLFVLMQWIVDVPTQYPDHGLATVAEDLLSIATCLVAEIEQDPGAYGVGADFQVQVEPQLEDSSTSGAFLEVSGWFRSSTVTSVDDTAILIESDLNPLADGDQIPTNCGAF